MSELNVDICASTDRQTTEGTARCWAPVRKVVLSLSLALACQSALAQATYRIKPLGVLGGCTASAPAAAALNDAGEVVGSACNANGDTHAFVWKNDGAPMVDLGPDKVGAVSYATDINASGLVAVSGGISAGDGTPLRKIPGLLCRCLNYFNPSSINDLGQLTGSVWLTLAPYRELHAFLWNGGSRAFDLGTLGGHISSGRSINASGQVAGMSYLLGSAAFHAFIWKNDGTPMLDLGTLGGENSSAGAINASGQVAGQSNTLQATQTHAFIWRNDGTRMQDLGTLGGVESYFSALNNSGQVTGYSYTHGLQNAHAFAWMNDGTPMKNLGTFGGTISYANGINSSGQVTGSASLAGDTISHAFLWRHDGTKIQDLNKLVDPADPIKSYITLTSGDFINDRGDVLANGTDSRTGLSGPYLLQGAELTLSPRSLAFGSLPINTTSAAKSVTMTNTSANVVAIVSVALTGSAAGQFASTNNCGSSLVGHATCTIKVTFKPNAKGAKSATLNVNGGGGGLRSVGLTGTGT